jgi:V/A-type H+-transporting ATPase subunit I
LGVVALDRVSVIAPRSDYEEVAKRLSQFKDFHPIDNESRNFDPAVEELAVRAVRLYAQADQVVRDLSISLAPRMLDVIFRGVRIPRSEYQATDWKELLDKTERELRPIYDEVGNERSRLTNLVKEESDVLALMNSLMVISGFSADLERFSRPGKLKVVLAISDSETVPELQKSLSDMIFLSQKVSETQSLVLVAGPYEDAPRIEKSMKALEVKPFSLPENLPQNPAEAYKVLNQNFDRLHKDREDSEKRLTQLRDKNATTLLAVRELAESAHTMLDDVRMAGGLKRMAVISGYIPAARIDDFLSSFGGWLVHAEHAERLGDHGSRQVPTLMNNRGPLRPFEIITGQQGTPSGHEIDPTPVISFVFPIFFGMMFGDLGHGIIVSAFAFLIRSRARDNPNLRQWGNIFLAAGVSSSIFGIIFGEFFGFSLHQLVPIPPLVEIVVRPPIVSQATLDPVGTTIVLEVAILIGIAHITTGLALNVWEAIKSHETIELLTERIPSLTMYLSGVGFGLAFIGAGYSFNVFKTAAPAPLLGVPNSTLGTISVATVLASMLVLGVGKGVAIITGKLEGESAGSAFANGAIEVFEKISAFSANTISYARLAILLFVHASLLLAINLLTGFPLYISALPLVIFNILIILLEALVVYIQDLRLHIYEFFTKFYEGEGTPFRKIFPDRVRVKINWT